MISRRCAARRARIQCRVMESIKYPLPEDGIPRAWYNIAPDLPVAGTIREALRAKQEGARRTILFNLCDHGPFDVQAYIDYHAARSKITITPPKRSPWRWPDCLPCKWRKGP